jgi:hypothetical protein
MQTDLPLITNISDTLKRVDHVLGEQVEKNAIEKCHETVHRCLFEMLSRIYDSLKVTEGPDPLKKKYIVHVCIYRLMINFDFPGDPDFSSTNADLKQSIPRLFPNCTAREMTSLCGKELYVLDEQLKEAINPILYKMLENKKTKQKEFLLGIEKIFVWYITVNTHCFERFFRVPRQLSRAT